MSQLTAEQFIKNYEKDVRKFTETKTVAGRKLSYLSWAYAVRFLKEQDPNSCWYFKDDIHHTDGTVTVECALTAFGSKHTMMLPVLNGANKAINSPDAFAINTARMRCLAKCIATATGLGLSLYTGEDLADLQDAPAEQIEVPKEKPVKKEGMTEEQKGQWLSILNRIPECKNEGALAKLTVEMKQLPFLSKKHYDYFEAQVKKQWSV